MSICYWSVGNLGDSWGAETGPEAVVIQGAVAQVAKEATAASEPEPTGLPGKWWNWPFVGWMYRNSRVDKSG